MEMKTKINWIEILTKGIYIVSAIAMIVLIITAIHIGSNTKDVSNSLKNVNSNLEDINLNITNINTSVAFGFTSLITSVDMYIGKTEELINNIADSIIILSNSFKQVIPKKINKKNLNKKITNLRKKGDLNQDKSPSYYNSDRSMWVDVETLTGNEKITSVKDTKKPYFIDEVVDKYSKEADINYNKGRQEIEKEYANLKENIDNIYPRLNIVEDYKKDIKDLYIVANKDSNEIKKLKYKLKEYERVIDTLGNEIAIHEKDIVDLNKVVEQFTNTNKSVNIDIELLKNGTENNKKILNQHTKCIEYIYKDLEIPFTIKQELEPEYE